MEVIQAYDNFRWPDAWGQPAPLTNAVYVDVPEPAEPEEIAETAAAPGIETIFGKIGERGGADADAADVGGAAGPATETDTEKGGGGGRDRYRVKRGWELHENCVDRYQCRAYAALGVLARGRFFNAVMEFKTLNGSQDKTVEFGASLFPDTPKSRVDKLMQSWPKPLMDPVTSVFLHVLYVNLAVKFRVEDGKILHHVDRSQHFTVMATFGKVTEQIRAFFTARMIGLPDRVPVEDKSGSYDKFVVPITRLMPRDELKLVAATFHTTNYLRRFGCNATTRHCSAILVINKSIPNTVMFKVLGRSIRGFDRMLEELDMFGTADLRYPPGKFYMSDTVRLLGPPEFD